jgi:hypothetical protein
LLLYGTGFRHHSGLNNVKVTINGANAEVLFAERKAILSVWINAMFGWHCRWPGAAKSALR